MTQAQAKEAMKALKFRDGLVTAVTRDFRTKEVLMVAMQNRRAVLKTLTTGLMYYWSRSRGKLWLKGEQSGHYQRVRRMLVDCDGDVLLFDVKQVGVPCHKGYRSCFYREVKQGKLVTVLKRKFRPEEIYGRQASSK
jgi:phosphoribosyl-AMP cyclohydrolase